MAAEAPEMDGVSTGRWKEFRGVGEEREGARGGGAVGAGADRRRRPIAEQARGTVVSGGSCSSARKGGWGRRVVRGATRFAGATARGVVEARRGRVVEEQWRSVEEVIIRCEIEDPVSKIRSDFVSRGEAQPEVLPGGQIDDAFELCRRRHSVDVSSGWNSPPSKDTPPMFPRLQGVKIGGKTAIEDGHVLSATRGRRRWSAK